MYDTYWRFAAERHAIFQKRVQGHPGPWTEDPILARFKFCNAYRAADRVTQYLLSRVIYSDRYADLSAEDVFLRVVLFRLFSKESTWDLIEQSTGGTRRDTLDVDLLGDVLEEARRTHPIYTNAFILAAPNQFGHSAKHRNHLALVKHMFRAGGLGERVGRARSLKEVYEALTSYPMIGPFLGYQIATDLNYTSHIDFSENDFTMPGPGALRGLDKVFSDFGGCSPQHLILRMVDRQDEEFDRLGLDFTGLFGRPLHAIDCQSLFCETDKYCRQRFPHLKSNRVRIKQEFRPTETPLTLFFPPKWGLDTTGFGAREESESKQLVFGESA